MNQLWTQLEIQLLKNNFLMLPTIAEVQCLFPNRSWVSINCKARKLGLMTKGIKLKRLAIDEWPVEEVTKLKLLYEECYKKDILLAFPNRSWAALKNQAQKLKLRMKLNRVKNGDLSKLLQETTEAYYWMGFLLADGHFSENRVNLTLGEKEKEHVYKFATFLKSPIDAVITSTRETNYSKEATTFRIAVYNKYLINKIRDKFNIHTTNKTEFPPNLSKIFSNTSTDNAIALIIGFIDGDGYIGSKNIRIEIHKSWEANLKILSHMLLMYFSEVSKQETHLSNSKENKYVHLNIAKHSLLIKIYNWTATNKLPVLERKWTNLSALVNN